MSESKVIDLGEGVSRETRERLEVFVKDLLLWNPAINLVSRATLDDLWTRHVLDSLQIFNCAPETAGSWADLGSGGGFPGLVVAAVAAERRPLLKMTLVESDQRKATFLRLAARDMGLDIDVRAERAEAIPPLHQDVVSARALAPLPLLCAYANRHLAPGGAAIFLKGAAVSAEIDAARKSWNFDLETRPSITDPSAAILLIRNLSHV